MSNPLSRAGNVAIKQFERLMFRHCFVDFNPDWRSAILVAGAGRSGTTWLSEIINYRNEYRSMFEPFHVAKLPQLRGVLNEHQYVRGDYSGDKYKRLMDDVLSGRFKASRVDRNNRRLFSNKRLVKAIHANLFLKWMRTTYPALPMVFVLRHPLAVANSRLQRKWSVNLGVFLEQSELMEDHLHPFKALLEEPLSEFEGHIVTWCITNYVPLRQLVSGDVHLVFYENLIVDPRREVESLFRYLGKAPDPASIEAAGKPSAHSADHSAVVTGKNPLTPWRDTLSRRQVERGMEIVSRFGLDAIYGFDPLPNEKGLYTL